MKHLWHSHHPFRIFWFSALLTLALGGLIFGHFGASGLWLFAILVVLEVTFSFDGVIGAFAITSSVLLIVAGLGAGAIWVRSLTVYLLRTGMLSKYKYLENGAHWAIMALGMMMIAKLFHLELPEWATGGLGLLFVSLAVGSSMLEARAINLQEAAAAKLHNAERRLKHGAAKIVPRRRR